MKIRSRFITGSILIFFLFVITIDAGNRKGSKRVGGTNSKGKGSHYVGGKKK
ncbi:hypothetical protein KHM19_15780 [Leptospira borgpetersenii]|uniref:Uncharacterized protein n=3 Tax=Leptospira borgpetersenii TaxID=174 RepID=M3GU36_LEPBO|nr:hypothetical protein LEP1GSC128_3953 [Leptospira borgpetersenii str. 200801926]EKQ93922.1 hypothetical protein LEP1GSC101_1703 [Leptospira borgpetersenii str. UI 09149]EMF98348.1 hypothetical protein LEP1GSC123_1718 [Leptospira borgpetersenii str. 200701203]EMK11628.1 hypothetical protein LEP1GSC066_2117 [Leptospira sp. serovar Kenya str. Sh9]EMN57544.1 hypothetical protein LEP1GSC090_2297 [Leptospira borgpetersenii serovar Javanica str. MK146]ENO64836.1 hypothetical protein LEP1GSC191_1658